VARLNTFHQELVRAELEAARESKEDVVVEDSESVETLLPPGFYSVRENNSDVIVLNDDFEQVSAEWMVEWDQQTRKQHVDKLCTAARLLKSVHKIKIKDLTKKTYSSNSVRAVVASMEVRNQGREVGGQCWICQDILFSWTVITYNTNCKHIVCVTCGQMMMTKSPFTDNSTTVGPADPAKTYRWEFKRSGRCPICFEYCENWHVAEHRRKEELPLGPKLTDDKGRVIAGFYRQNTALTGILISAGSVVD
jgi:hypothetical protein